MPGDARGGAVLLETVIVIPLYLLLIGGMLWVGDLILAKQRLVVADRYMAWNIGNRHRNIQNIEPIIQEVQAGFFPTGRYLNYAQINMPADNLPGAGGWWWRGCATVDLLFNMPVWTRGWLAAPEAFYSSPAQAGGAGVLPGTIVMKGRDLDPARTGDHHVVVMRSGGSDRGTAPGVIAGAWSDISSSAWPYN